MRLTRKQAILIKQESTQGTDSTPAGATDGLLVEGLEFNFDTEQLTRDYYRASLDSVASVTGKRSASVKFTTELKGSGTRGTAVIAGWTALDAAIQACGYTSTVSAAVSITWAPTSSPASANYFGPGKSVTIVANKDGVQHKLLGCVGTWKYLVESGQYPKLEFEFSGAYSAATDVAIPTITLGGSLPLPVAWESSAITIAGSASVIVDKIEVDTGNTVIRRDDPRVATAVKGFVITGRAPKGTVDYEAELVAGFDTFGKVLSNVEASTSIVHGTVSGNICTLTFPKTQLVGNTYGDKNGIMMYSSALQFNQTTGDDWAGIVIT
jgi:hypothetical protein